MNPKERSSGCGWSMKSLIESRKRDKSKWLTSLNNNRKRWKITT